MKRGLLAVLLFAFLFSFSFVVAGTCDDDQIIMRLHSTSTSTATNAHVSEWDQNPGGVYEYQVCYDEIFGRDYLGADPHGKTAYNDVLYVYSDFNSHISMTEDAVFTESINYGNLACEAEAGTDDVCLNGGELLLRATSDYNSHVAGRETLTNPDTSAYNVKICCYDVYWANTNGQVINTAYIGQTVLMVVPTGHGASFEISAERDGVVGMFADHYIETVDGNDDGYRVVGTWTITQDDYEDTAAGNDIDRDFYFESGPLESPRLKIYSSATSDVPMVVEVTSPRCGEYFDQDQDVEIGVSVDDPDDLVEGKLEIFNSDSDVLETYTYDNFGLSETYAFIEAGEYRIIATTTSSRGDSSVVVSNIMVLDTSVDRNYTAACLSSPVSNEDYQENRVYFDASPTRGVQVVGGSIGVFGPSDGLFDWKWDFSASDGSGVGTIGAKLYSDGPTDDSGYWDFHVIYPYPGQKSASLVISF